MAEFEGDPFAKYGGSEVKVSQSGDPFAKYGGSEVKKNPIPPAGASSLPKLPGGGIPDLNSLTSTPERVTPFTEEYKQHLEQQKQDRVDAANKQLKDVYNKLDPDTKKSWDRTMQMAYTRPSDNLYQTSPEQIKDQRLMDTPGGKILASMQYLGGKAAKGTVQIAKGAAWLTNHLNTGFTDVQMIPDKSFEGLDKAANLGLSESNQAKIEEGKGLGYGALKTGGMLAEFAPAVLGGEVTKAPQGLFALQGMGQGKETVDALKKSGVKLDPMVENGFVLGSGAVNLLLTDLSSNFGKLTSDVKNRVVSSIVSDAIQKSAGKELTGEAFNALLKDGAKTFADKWQQGGLNYLTRTVDNFKTLGKLQAANFLLKEATNQAQGEEVFKNPAGELAEGLYKTATQDAPIFGAIGSLDDAASVLNPYTQMKNDVVRSLVDNHTDENIAATKQAVLQNLPPEQQQATADHIDKIAQVAKSLPKGLSENKQSSAVDLIINRNDMQKQLADIQAEKVGHDEAIREVPTKSEQYLTDKIDQANDKLVSIVSGKKVQYVGDEETGKYQKLLPDGTKENISKSRYDLEQIEKPVKIEANEKNNEVREQPSGQETGQSGNEENGSSKEAIPAEKEEVKKTGAETPLAEVENKSPDNANQEAISEPQGGESVSTKEQKGEQQNAIQEPSTGEVGVREQGTMGEEVGGQNEPKESAKEGEKSSGQKEKITSRQNSEVDKSREKRGLPPLFSEQAKSDPELWDEAMKRIDENPHEADDIIAKFKSKPYALTDVENTVLLHRRLTLENELDRIDQKIVDEPDNNALHDQRRDVADSLHDLDKIDRETGTQSGRALRARQLALKNDFSIARLELRKRAALGRELTPEELADVKKVHAEYQEKSKAYESKIAELEQRNKDLLEKQALDKLKAEARKEARGQRQSDRQRNRQDLVQDIRNKLKASRKSGTAMSDIPFRKQFAELIAISPELAKLAKSYIAEGIDKLDELVDKIHGDLKDAFGDSLDKRAVRDALSGYGREYEPQTKGEVQAKLDELKKQARLISKIEDLEAKEYKAPEKQKAAISKELETLRKQARELQQPDISLKSIKTRTANQIAELERRIREKDFTTAPKRPPTELDPEAIKAKADLNRVKNNYEAELEKDRLANRGIGEKTWDTFLKYRRAELLLNLSGAAKVGMASAYRILSQPIHELAGEVTKRVLPGVAKKAAREGHGFVSDVEWKAAKTVWSAETLAEVKKKFKGQLDNLDTAFGDKKEHFDVNRLLDLAGNIHSAEKEFAKQNEFRRSVLLRTKYAQEHGIDTDNPFVQLKIGKEALEDANRQIFMADNLAHKEYSDLLTKWDAAAKNKDAKWSGTKRALAGGMRLLLPIVKVPTNYLIEKAQYTPILGATKAFWLIAHGIKNLKPEEADYVMRIFKKQSLGAGLLALGYFNPTAFGGFHVPGQKYQGTENDVNVLGVKIPHFLTHTPLLTIMQLGATIRHAADGSKTPGSDVAMANLSDLAESTPFYETPRQAVKAMESAKSMQQFVGSFARGLIVPNFVSQIAAHYDTDENGEPIKHSPKSVTDAIKEGIPGLREQVPIKSPHPGFDKIHIGDKTKQLDATQVQERQKFYNEYLKTDGAKVLLKEINDAKTKEAKDKLRKVLHTIASKYSKGKIMHKYYNPETGGYDLQDVEE